MPSSGLETIETTLGDQPTHCVIWLHGLGADGNDFVPIVPQLGLPAGLSIRFVFPHAPKRAITLNYGMEMRGWYDLKSLQLDRSEQDPEGVKQSVEQIFELIEDQIEQGFSARQIVLAGFSQGGAIALQAGLTGPYQLAGVLGLSTYLPVSEEQFSRTHNGHTQTPLFLGHGRYDSVVAIQYAEKSKDILEHCGFQPRWRSYMIDHGVTAEEINDVSHWLQKVLGYSDGQERQ